MVKQTTRRYLYKIMTVCILLSATHGITQDTTFTNTVGMEFILMKPGHFVMGKFQPPYPQAADTVDNTNTESKYSAAQYALAKKLAEKDARPGFPVAINQSFYIGKFEVTQAQWKKVMGTNPSAFQGDKVSDDADNHPVENVTWNDVQQFLKKLNGLEKGSRYRLPTEAEWEYAARAGATEDMPWTQIRAVAQLDGRTTSHIGSKAPNAWGLYDMLGNVWAWGRDFYNEKLFADPVPPKQGSQHVLKGASFTGDVKNATYMTHAAGPGNGWDVGFRVMLEVKK